MQPELHMSVGRIETMLRNFIESLHLRVASTVKGKNLDKFIIGSDMSGGTAVEAICVPKAVTRLET